MHADSCKIFFCEENPVGITVRKSLWPRSATGACICLAVAATRTQVGCNSAVEPVWRGQKQRESVFS